MERSVQAYSILLAILQMGHLVKTQFSQMEEVAGVKVTLDYLKFKYYNRNNPKNPYLINITNENLIEELKKFWDYQEDLKIITHGWISSETSGAVGDIKDAYLEKYSHNVVTLDWSKTAATMNYAVGAMMTYEVGKLVAEVINKLVELNFTQYKNIHMIGHSLGAHVSGATGAHCKEKIARITGLDAAGPGFSYVFSNTDMRLDDSDAMFVDSIHTAVGMAGYSSPLGHADFYPNSGKSPQPGCYDVDISMNIFNTISSTKSLAGCSHSRAYELFIESIKNPKAFKSVRCDSWSLYKSGQCSSDVQYMGDSCSPTARGVYYLTTNAKPPFSISEMSNNSVIDTADSMSVTGDR